MVGRVSTRAPEATASSNGRGNVTDVDTPLPGMSGLGPDDGTIYHTCSTYERAPDEYDNQ